MAFLHEEEDDHNHNDEKKEYGRYLSEPQKAYLTGEFAKFGGHALRQLASACECDQGGRGERQTKT